jgi:hypothetical protein
VLCQATQGRPAASSDLLTDMFGTLQIYKPDFFRGENGWEGIPQEPIVTGLRAADQAMVTA